MSKVRSFFVAAMLAASVAAPAMAQIPATVEQPAIVVADNSQLCSGRFAENRARLNIRRAKKDVADMIARGIPAKLVVINPGHQIGVSGVLGEKAPSAPVYSLHC